MMTSGSQHHVECYCQYGTTLPLHPAAARAEDTALSLDRDVLSDITTAQNDRPDAGLCRG